VDVCFTTLICFYLFPLPINWITARTDVRTKSREDIFHRIHTRLTTFNLLVFPPNDYVIISFLGTSSLFLLYNPFFTSC
jgi:hypothetical protein